MEQVTVIIPVYHPEKLLLERAVRSVLEQTWNNIELLLVIDDRETDMSVYEDLLRRESRTLVTPAAPENHFERTVNVLHTSGSTGVAAARNFGLANARGMWICFLDQDDYYDLTFVEVLVHSAKSQEKEMMMTGFSLVDEESSVIRRYPRKRNSADGEWLYWSTCAIWNRIYKREALEKYGIRFPEGCYTEDMLFVLQCNESMSYGNVIEEQLYYNYQNPRSTSRSSGFNRLSLDQMPWRQLEIIAAERNRDKDRYAVGFILNEIVLLTYVLSRRSEQKICHEAEKKARKLFLKLCGSMSEKTLREIVRHYTWNAELNFGMKMLIYGYMVASFHNAEALYGKVVRKLLNLR